MAIQVTDDLVRHIAKLSRLAISEKEAKGVQQHFEKILAYIADFQALDTKAVDPSIFAGDASNVDREDAVKASLDRKLALQNAPQSDGAHFVVPRIVGAPTGGAQGPGATSDDLDAGGDA